MANRYFIVHETTLQSWTRDASSFALAAALIGAGRLIDSSALQWLGAIIFFIICLARGSGLRKEGTTAEIRAELDRIDAESAKSRITPGGEG